MAGTALTRAQRTERAVAFLREAVYRSREVQASTAGLAAPRPGGGQCGLGEKAEVALDLTARGRELFEELWPAGLAAPGLERVRAVTSAWVERQDALDRKRNHFMKDFRQRNGFDRTLYDARQSAAWEAGLGAVNDEADARLRESADALLRDGD